MFEPKVFRSKCTVLKKNIVCWDCFHHLSLIWRLGHCALLPALLRPWSLPDDFLIIFYGYWAIVCNYAPTG